MSIKNLSIYTIMVMAILAITSCDNDPHDPDIVLSGDISGLVPSYSARLSCSVSTSNKHISLTAEPTIYLDLDKWGLRVDKVDYYIDDVYCETKTVSPYKFTYESNEWTTGAHNLRADISISGKNIETLILPCTKDLDNSSHQSEAVDIYFDYNRVGPGEEFFIAAYLNEERSAPSTKVTSFTGEWNGVTLGTKNYSPYKLTRTVTEEAGTKHSVSAKITYTQGSVTTNYSFSFSQYEICGPTTVAPTYRIKSGYNDFENGDYLRGVARIFIGSEVKATYGFELYLDDVLIAETRQFPYDHEYKLSNLSVGEHTLKEQWVRYNLDGQKLSSYSTDEIITITK